MNRRCLLALVVLCLGCREAAEVSVDPPPPAVSTDFSRLAEVLAGIPPEGRVVLYEGLPSEFWEPQLREQELAQKLTLDVHGHPVYEDELAPSDEDARQLTKLLAARESYQAYNNRKKCGGFSADCCVEWAGGEPGTQMLVSLECGEVKIYSPKGELYCDITADVHEKLKKILSAYRKNPPGGSEPR